jgi:hypothetical protein
MKQDPKSRQIHGGQPAAGHEGRPLDGSQYVDVIEEQRYAELRPTLDAREPHTAPDGHRPEPGSQSIGSQNAPGTD